MPEGLFMTRFALGAATLSFAKDRFPLDQGIRRWLRSAHGLGKQPVGFQEHYKCH
jgi:hypothetical protein